MKDLLASKNDDTRFYALWAIGWIGNEAEVPISLHFGSGGAPTVAPDAPFTTAIVTAVSAVAVTLDPESVLFMGRLRPLVDEVLPEVRRRLDKSLTTVPEVKLPTQVLGLSVARGAVYACLGMARDRLRDAVLEARRLSQDAERSAPAF